MQYIKGPFSPSSSWANKGVVSVSTLLVSSWFLEILDLYLTPALGFRCNLQKLKSFCHKPQKLHSGQEEVKNEEFNKCSTVLPQTSNYFCEIVGQATIFDSESIARSRHVADQLKFLTMYIG